MPDKDLTRRSLLRGAGGVLIAGLAGCEDNGSNGEVPSRIDDHLSGVTSNYDGSITDRTDQDEVVVDVGASGNGGNRAFAPPALRITTGTTVRFEWNTRSAPHNVVSTADSDFAIDSGDPAITRVPFPRTFETAGIALYVCEQHEEAGMVGAIQVVE